MTHKIHLILLPVLLVLTLACDLNRLAGGGTDTETALVAGIVTKDGSPVAGADVIIDGDNSSSDVTGSDGKFEIKEVEYGTHSLLAEWYDGSTRYYKEISINVKSKNYNVGTMAIIKAIAKR